MTYPYGIARASRVPNQFFLIDLITFSVSSVHCFNTALFFRTSPFSSPVLTLTAMKGGRSCETNVNPRDSIYSTTVRTVSFLNLPVPDKAKTQKGCCFVEAYSLVL